MKKDSDEIGREATRLVIGTIEKLAQLAGLKALPNELKDEIGIDSIFEILSRSRDTEDKAYGMFYTQNKGTDTKVTPLTTGANLGTISFQLEKTAHIEYFCLQLDQPIAIMLCDLTASTIYWLPIQLHAERYIQELKRIKNDIASGDRKSDTIQVYFDPTKCILQDGVANESNFTSFLADMKASKEYLVNRFKSQAKFYYRGQRPLAGLLIDRQKHIIDQLHDYFAFRFKELNFVPVDYLIHHYPIEPNEGATASRFDAFTLKPGNKLLWNLFERITFDKGLLQEGYPAELNSVNDLGAKLKRITQRLHSLGVFYIEDNRAKYVEVPTAASNTECLCSRCLFDKLKYAQALASLKNHPQKLDDKLKQAYVHYKFGHFTRAIDITQACAIDAFDSRQYEWYLVSKYNLSKLGSSLAHFAWGDQTLMKHADKLRSISPSQIVQLHPNTPNQEALEALANEKIFSTASAKIETLCTQIREQYHNQLRGGSSSNSYVDELLCEFDQIQSLFHDNYITFEGFSNFGHLFEKVIEGTFASHAITPTQNSRMPSFSEGLVMHIIHHGDADFIRKIFRRYELKELIYSAKTDSPYHFGTLINNFFAELPLIPEELNFDTNLFFRQRSNKMFATLMTLAGILKLERETEQNIYRSLVPFLESGIIDNSHALQYVQYFIARKGKNLSTETTKAFLRVAYEHFEFYESGFVETLASQLAVTKDKLTAEEFSRIIQPITVNVDDEHREDVHTSLVYLFPVSAPTSQSQISEMISSQLAQRFSGQLYYLSMIFDIIPFDEAEFSMFVDDSRIKKNQVSWSSLMGSKDKRFPHVSAMFNLAFKLGQNTNSPQFESYRGIDPYYDWLIDMDGFDYSKFNPKWIKEYDTKFYLDEIMKRPKIIELIKVYLKENSDPTLRDFFIHRLL